MGLLVHIGGIFKSRMQQIESDYKLIEVLSGRRGSAYTVVNVATVEFRFGAAVLIEKLVFNIACEKIGVAASYFRTYSQDIDLFIMMVRE